MVTPARPRTAILYASPRRNTSRYPLESLELSARMKGMRAAIYRAANISESEVLIPLIPTHSERIIYGGLVMTLRATCSWAFALGTILTATGLQATGAPAQESDIAADKAAINKLFDQVVTAFNDKDAPILAAFYAEDAVVMNQGDSAVEGKRAIQAEYENIFKSEVTIRLVAFDPAEVQVLGDWAHARGNYTAVFTPKSGKPREQSFKYLSIIKRHADGSWKIYRDISNTNRPPAEGTGKGT